MNKYLSSIVIFALILFSSLGYVYAEKTEISTTTDINQDGIPDNWVVSVKGNGNPYKGELKVENGGMSMTAINDDNPETSQVEWYYWYGVYKNKDDNDEPLKIYKKYFTCELKYNDTNNNEQIWIYIYVRGTNGALYIIRYTEEDYYPLYSEKNVPSSFTFRENSVLKYQAKVKGANVSLGYPIFYFGHVEEKQDGRWYKISRDLDLDLMTILTLDDTHNQNQNNNTVRFSYVEQISIGINNLEKPNGEKLHIRNIYLDNESDLTINWYSPLFIDNGTYKDVPDINRLSVDFKGQVINKYTGDPTEAEVSINGCPIKTDSNGSFSLDGVPINSVSTNTDEYFQFWPKDMISVVAQTDNSCTQDNFMVGKEIDGPVAVPINLWRSYWSKSKTDQTKYLWIDSGFILNTDITDGTNRNDYHVVLPWKAVPGFGIPGDKHILGFSYNLRSGVDHSMMMEIYTIISCPDDPNSGNGLNSGFCRIKIYEAKKEGDLEKFTCEILPSYTDSGTGKTNYRVNISYTMGEKWKRNEWASKELDLNYIFKQALTNYGADEAQYDIKNIYSVDIWGVDGAPGAISTDYSTATLAAITDLYFRGEGDVISSPVINSYSPEEKGITISEGESIDFVLNVDSSDSYKWNIINLSKNQYLEYPNSVPDANSNSFRYQPTYYDAGEYKIIGTAISESGFTKNHAWNVKVNDVNGLPILSPIGDKTVTEGQELKFTVSATDPDGDTLTLSAEGIPQGATFNTETGLFTWTPEIEQSGVYAVTFKAIDVKGGEDIETVTITVNNLNRPPVAKDEEFITNEDTSLLIELTASDPDGDTLSYEIIEQPSHGGVIDLTYIPKNDYYGDDGFTFKVNDGTADSNTATVTVKINPVNDPPIAVGDSVETSENEPVDIDVLDNDSDVDSEIITIVSVTSPKHGDAKIIGEGIRYTPDTNWSGVDTFIYSVSDNDGGSASATITVTVNPVIISDDSSSTSENTSTPDTKNEEAITNNDYENSTNTETNEGNTQTQEIEGTVSPSSLPMIIFATGKVTAEEEKEEEKEEEVVEEEQGSIDIADEEDEGDVDKDETTTVNNNSVYEEDGELNEERNDIKSQNKIVIDSIERHGNKKIITSIKSRKKKNDTNKAMYEKIDKVKEAIQENTKGEKKSLLERIWDIFLKLFLNMIGVITYLGFSTIKHLYR